MKVNFKVKMKVTIEFPVEKYSRNYLHFLEKYFTGGNIQPSRDFLDTLYIFCNVWLKIANYILRRSNLKNSRFDGRPIESKKSDPINKTNRIEFSTFDPTECTHLIWTWKSLPIDIYFEISLWRKESFDSTEKFRRKYYEFLNLI